MLERCLLSPNLKDDAFVPIARQLSALVDLALATGISPKVRLEHLRASLTSLFKVIESVEAEYILAYFLIKTDTVSHNPRL
jgi:hypothetical protein